MITLAIIITILAASWFLGHFVAAVEDAIDILEEYRESGS